MNEVNGLPKPKNSDWPIAPDVTSISKLNKSGHSYKQPAAASLSPSPINNISHKLDQMLEIIQTQNCQISELRNEIIGLKQNRADGDESLKVEANKIEIRLSKLIEEYLIRYEREHNKKLEAFIGGRCVKELNKMKYFSHTIVTEIIFFSIAETHRTAKFVRALFTVCRR